jgi:ferric-dicitrate binding protein FerR (iron transport regulator)
MAAVVFTAVIIGTIIAVNLTVSPEVSEQEPDFKIFATKKGERATVHLADGSRVILNADSRLTVPGNFRDGDRSVQFEGQGYFDVASIEERPFIVQTTLADVRVLGTEFDVDAHQDAVQMQVVVATGEVSVRSNHLDEAESIILRPRDLGIVLQAGGQLVRRNIDVDRYIAWREGRLVFENASFKEVATMLERWYDLSVQLQNPSENVDGLTATFEDEPVDEVLNVIAAALNLNYRRDGKSVTFHPAS